MSTKNGKLTPGEKAFWKDAFIACARETITTDQTPNYAIVCADFADAALAVYRERIIWRKGHE